MVKTIRVIPWYELDGEAMFEAFKREGFNYQEIQTLREIDPQSMQKMKEHGKNYNTTFIRTMGFFLNSAKGW